MIFRQISLALCTLCETFLLSLCAEHVGIYLGVNIYPKNKDEIIEAAKKLNPEIKIYQMTTDPEAFKLKEKEIEEI